MGERKLGAINIAFLCVGAIVGAGFASGREIWQFFGVFEDMGIIGMPLLGSLLILVGVMTCAIARKLNTNHLGRVIVPGNSKVLTAAVGYFMAYLLFSVLIIMSAAGGALFHQQFGLSRVLGGAVIIILVVLTVIGGFDRVARVFGFMMPVLVVTVITVCLLVITSDLPKTQIGETLTPSPLAPHWALSAVLYVSYNILGFIPIVATASLNAKSKKHAHTGAVLGGLFLTILAFFLLSAMRTDMSFSQAMDLPMLAFASRLSPVLNFIYTIILFFAIYGSATTNYYGFSTRLPDTPKKKWIIIGMACVGFLLGLMGFKNVIAYLFPIEGFLGIGIMIMITVNFITVMKKSKTKRKTM